MLYERPKIIAVPICESSETAVGDENTRGARASAAANPIQMLMSFLTDMETLACELLECMDMDQLSLFPSSPLGRKINTRTRSAYGRMGATCATVTLSTECPKVSLVMSIPINCSKWDIE